MADNLATDAQLSLLMEVSGLSEEVATLLLEMATGEVQAMAMQRLVLVEDDEFSLYGSTSREFVLPERPVIEVSELSIDGDDELVEGTDYIRATGSARLFRRCGWADCPTWPSIITGVYSHGYASDDQRLVPAQNATYGLARQVAVNPSGVESESIDDYRVQFGRDLAAASEGSSYLRTSLRHTYGTRAGAVRAIG